MTTDTLRIVPLGGLGEIGMNCLCLETARDLVMIDCGIQFPDVSYTGVDLLIPDFTYVLERKDKLRGIVVTHGHDDHIGAIALLARDLPLDIYCTPFPAGLIRQKASEFAGLHELNLHEIGFEKPFAVGAFQFHPLPVHHSIIESLGFAIETPVGTIVHTGDFKHDPLEKKYATVEPFANFKPWGKRGVKVLFSDSTNAEKIGHTLSETEVEKTFEKFFMDQKGRLFIALFASNIRRVERLLKLGHQHGKKIALAGRSMHSYTKLAHEQSSLDIPSGTLVLLENSGIYPDDKVVILLTGSQAEPRSALRRIARGNHEFIQVRAGDTVILSSRFIPGNERTITRMIDQLYRLGAEVIYESFHKIHVSGHGFQGELRAMLEATRPDFFVPIHGEYRHLAKHSKIALEVGVKKENAFTIENGQVMELTSSGFRYAEKLEHIKNAIVDGMVMEGSTELFEQRARLSRAGIVIVFLRLSEKTGIICEKPRMATYGLLYQKGVSPEQVHLGAVKYLEEVLSRPMVQKDLSQVVELETRRFLKKWVSPKPVVKVHLDRVSAKVKVKVKAN